MRLLQCTHHFHVGKRSVSTESRRKQTRYRSLSLPYALNDVDCVDEWFRGHKTCPNCRAQLGLEGQVDGEQPCSPPSSITNAAAFVFFRHALSFSLTLFYVNVGGDRDEDAAAAGVGIDGMDIELQQMMVNPPADMVARMQEEEEQVHPMDQQEQSLTEELVLLMEQEEQALLEEESDEQEEDEGGRDDVPLLG